MITLSSILLENIAAISRNRCAELAGTLTGDGAAAPELRPAQSPRGELELDGNEVIDRDQDHEQDDAEPKAPADQLFLDR
jgi:hypothetical protein